MREIEAVMEIAGGDSFAAAAKYVAESRPAAILPTYVHTGTEFGDFTVIDRHVDLLREDLGARFGTVVEPMAVSSNPELWHALNGRFITEIREGFGFYSPCIGCHLYLHLMRVPAAARIGAGVIVAGERECHSSGTKINQTAAVLDAFAAVIESAGYDLVMPVRHSAKREELLEFAPWLWEEGREQMKCVLSGNYRAINGEPVLPAPEQEQHYIEEFLIPAGRTLAGMLLTGETAYIDAVAEVLEVS